MREKLNNDPKTQVAAIAVLVVIGLLFFLKSSGGEEEGEVASEAGPTVATVNGSTATGATPGEAVEAAISGIEGASTGTGAMPSSVPAPPPPADFVSAYEAGGTVVLLVVNDGGIDDRRTEAATAAIEGLPDVTLFRVPVRQLPRYASVTVGLNVNRVPALIVMRPKKLSNGVPQASVDYGFQTTENVLQAVLDANYEGAETTYHPD